jgi:hypothetical protein
VKSQIQVAGGAERKIFLNAHARGTRPQPFRAGGVVTGGGMRGQIAVRVNVKSLFIAHKKSLAG